MTSEPAYAKARRRTVWGVYGTVGIAVMAVMLALTDTGDGHDWRDRLVGVALGLLAWVGCTAAANSLAQPLVARKFALEDAQLATSAALGAAMAAAAFGIANLHGSWAALAAGAGWLVGGATGTALGLPAWLAAFDRDDAVGRRLRQEVKLESPLAALVRTGVWFLPGVLFAVWVSLLEGRSWFVLVAMGVQAGLMAALAFALQGRRLFR